MAGRKVAIYNCARALDDNDIYILQMFDTSPSGLLVKAYRQTESVEYFMPITESELDNAALSRSQQALSKLAESLSLVELSGKLVLMSSITGIIKPKVLPSGDGVRQFIGRTKAGRDALSDFLSEALSDLCKEKPVGLDAVRWLGQWILKNNPNQPTVEEPTDMNATLQT